MTKSISKLDEIQNIIQILGHSWMEAFKMGADALEFMNIAEADAKQAIQSLIDSAVLEGRQNELEVYCDLLLGKQQEYLDVDWYDKSLSAEDVFRIKNDRLSKLKSQGNLDEL